MAIGTRSGESTSELAARLLREINSASRPTAEYIARLETIISDYERRYEIPSADVHRAIEENRLHETADVVEWIFTIRALERVKAR